MTRETSAAFCPAFVPTVPGWPAAACPCQDLVDQAILVNVLVDLMADEEGLLMLADVLRVMDEAGETG